MSIVTRGLGGALPTRGLGASDLVVIVDLYLETPVEFQDRLEEAGVFRNEEWRIIARYEEKARRLALRRRRGGR